MLLQKSKARENTFTVLYLFTATSSVHHLLSRTTTGLSVPATTRSYTIHNTEEADVLLTPDIKQWKSVEERQLLSRAQLFVTLWAVVS